MPIVAVNFICSSCRTENSVEVQTGGRNVDVLRWKCGFCQDEQPPEKLADTTPKEGKAIHQWVRGEEGWEQVF